jgi:hypothetical protein
MNKQQGSAHVIVVGVLVIALFGALGFIFWQNFINKEEVVTKTEVTTPAETKNTGAVKVDQTKTYDGSDYSFEYPANNWLVVETRNDYASNHAVNPEIQTDDYSPMANSGGIESGAKVTLYTTNNTNQATLEEDKRTAAATYPGIVNIRDTTLGGVPAYSYNSAHDGNRYITVAIKDSTFFQIVYRYAGENQDLHRNGYDTVVKTFKFK